MKNKKEAAEYTKLLVKRMKKSKAKHQEQTVKRYRQSYWVLLLLSLTPVKNKSLRVKNEWYDLVAEVTDTERSTPNYVMYMWTLKSWPQGNWD